MRIQELYPDFRDKDVFVIGTGPSASVFPWEFLNGKFTLGLNQAWRYLPLNYCLTAHPELLLEQEQHAEATGQRGGIKWIVKKKPPLEKLTLEDPRYYVYHSREDWGLFAKPEADVLFLGRGVQQTAIDLCCRAGAKSVILIGVDMGSLDGDHHGHHQHVRFHGLAPKDVYAEYRKWTAKARRLAREHYGVPVLTLSPLLGLTAPEEDYKRLHQELGIPKLPPPKDTSGYKRERADL